MKIIIDDTGNYISCEDFEIQISSPVIFNSTIELILTPTQYNNYIGYDTSRVFYISNKRFNYLKQLYEKDNTKNL